MKRTPVWVFLAAVAVQLAALEFCVWAMELALGKRTLFAPRAGKPEPEAAQAWTATAPPEIGRASCRERV